MTNQSNPNLPLNNAEIHARLLQGLLAKSQQRVSMLRFEQGLNEIQRQNQDLNFEKEPLIKPSKGLPVNKSRSNPYAELQIQDLKSLMKVLSQEVNQLSLQICDLPENYARNRSKTCSLRALERFQHLTGMLSKISLALQYKARHTDQYK